MSDKQVHALLQKWGFEDLTGVFQENQIDFEAFQLLTEDTIKELVPKIGQRLKFLREWKSEFAEESTLNPLLPSKALPSTSIESSSDSSHDTILVDSEEDSGPIENDQHMHDEEPSSGSLPVNLKRQNAFSFDVVKILSCDVKGQKVMESIKRKKFCSPSERRILVSLCVADMTKKHGMRPNWIVKEAMANAVIAAFPCLKDPQGAGYESFYTKGTKRRPAFGWLEDHLRYIRKKQLKLSSDSESGNPTTELQQPVKSPEDEESEVSVEEVIAMTEWMKHNLEPLNTVTEYMRKTANYRAKFIREDGKSVGNILERFPRLLTPGMLEQDFDYLQPGCKNQLYQKWDSLSGKLVTYADQVYPAWQDVLQIGKTLEACSKDEVKVLALFLVPLLFRGKSLSGKGAGTVANSLSSFIDVKPDVTSVADYCATINKKDRSQPFILSMGSHKLSPQQSFVIVERHPILQPSLLAAIDLCFKCHYVLDLSYQTQCKGAWEFFQSIVYNIGSVQNRALSAFRAYIRNESE